MTQESNKPVEMLACPMGCVGEVIGGEHEGACVYCTVCHLRAVSPEAWNTRLSSTPTADREAVLEEARRALIQNKRVNDAIQSALERGELHISDEGYLAALTTSPLRGLAGELEAKYLAWKNIGDARILADRKRVEFAEACYAAMPAILSALSRTPAVTDEAVEAALIIGSFLDVGAQEGVVRRARTWLDAHPEIEREALATLSHPVPGEQAPQSSAAIVDGPGGAADGGAAQ
jgi:hypothetical protein